MARKKIRRPKNTKKQKTKIVGPVAPSADLIADRRISNINLYIAMIGITWVLYPAFDYFLGQKRLLVGNGAFLAFACSLINPVFMFLATRINRYSKTLFDDRPDPEQLAKYRKLGKWQTIFALLINIIGFTPMLYAEGFVSKWAALLPGAEIIGQKLSFAVLFISAAIGAGLLGNFAYDILKYFFKKLVMKDG